MMHILQIITFTVVQKQVRHKGEQRVGFSMTITIVKLWLSGGISQSVMNLRGTWQKGSGLDLFGLG